MEAPATRSPTSTPAHVYQAILASTAPSKCSHATAAHALTEAHARTSTTETIDVCVQLVSQARLAQCRSISAQAIRALTMELAFLLSLAICAAVRTDSQA
jgi:hypothetical protein